MIAARSCESCRHFTVCAVRIDIRDALQGPGAAGFLETTDHLTVSRIYAAVGEGCREYASNQGAPEGAGG